MQWCDWRAAVIMKSVLLLLWPAMCTAKLLVLEAESSRGHSPKEERHRSQASGGKTLKVSEGSLKSYPFCLMQPTEVQLDSIIYMNDGEEDEIVVKIDKQKIGSFKTKPAWGGGALWDQPMGSGMIGDVMLLKEGMHRVKLFIKSIDKYGLELDSIILNVDDPFMTNTSKTFTCELPCIEETTPLISKAKSSVPKGRMVQKSYPTPCAEEDNVDIPVFHPSVSRYEITATPPLYRSLLNYRYEDTANCVFLPPEYWTFTNLNVDRLLESAPRSFGETTFGVSYTDLKSISAAMQFEAVFHLQGRTEGHINSEIGSQIELTLGGLTSNAEVTPFYRGRSKDFIKGETVKFTPPTSGHVWHLPDFTWKEDHFNQIILGVDTEQFGGIVIKHFELERRYMGPDKSFSMFSNSEVMIEGVDVDFWWRAPETMEVSLTTGGTWNHTDYLRISVPVPWNDTWCQVFVLYQDGNVRLVPITLPGADWIPFGTSVVVGQANQYDHRPVAPISKVLINPEDLIIEVNYRDGGFARFELYPLVEKTKLIVKDVIYTQDTSFNPFATFRSMFVDGGNDDSNSILTDKAGPAHVMGNWGELPGTSFSVYRRCQSNHLTQSPDLRLDILEG